MPGEHSTAEICLTRFFPGFWPRHILSRLLHSVADSSSVGSSRPRETLHREAAAPPGRGRGRLWGWTWVGNRWPGKVQWESRDVKTSTVLAFVAKTVRFLFSASFSFLDFIMLFKYADKKNKTCVSFKIGRDSSIILPLDVFGLTTIKYHSSPTLWSSGTNRTEY